MIAEGAALSENSSINDVLFKNPTLRELRNSQKTGEPGEFYITLPKFQRGVVWNMSQKAQLIDSIFQGFPVGALLGYQTGEKETTGKKPRDVYELVDGLQRTTTIINFLETPLVFAPIDELIDEETLAVIASTYFGRVSEDSLQLTKLSVEKWLREVGTTLREDGFTESRFQRYMREVPGIDAESYRLSQTPEFQDHIESWLGKIEFLVAQIQNVRVPMVIYTGPQQNVPEIFERINTQGIKLSKYEKFAAAWLHFSTKIENPDIVSSIQAKYQSLIARGYVVADIGDNDQVDPDDFNLFEYLFGLGKLLSKKFTYLFPESKEPDESPSLAFVIATVAHGLKISQMGSLAKCLKERQEGAGPLVLSGFEKAVIESAHEVEKALKAFMRVNLNNQGSSARFLPHSQNQIISMVVRYMIETHDTRDWAKKVSKNKDILLANFKAFYLYDIIQGRWSGSGDSKLWDVCWEGNEGEAIGRVPSNQYLIAPSREQWSSVLDAWHGSQLQKSQRERERVTGEAKLFLKYVYSDIVTVAQDETQSFDIEHLYSVAHLSEVIRANDSDDGWPMSAVGNLAILPVEINRKKGSQMIGDYLASDKTGDMPHAMAINLQKYVYSPEMKEIVSTQVLTKIEYETFCKKRFEALKSHLLDQIAKT